MCTPILVAAIGLLPAVAAGQHSVARQWNEAILDAIRIDTPRPPVHARNLYHLSAGMYDAWAALDPTAKGVFVHEKHLGGSDAARNEVISYAAYRILSHRYALSVNAAASQVTFDNLMITLGYDKAVTTTVGDSPAAIGNRVAHSVINASVHDGSNEANNYADTTGYTSVNVPMIAGYPTATDQAHAPMGNPNRWQPLYINSLTAQNGIVEPSNLQKYVGPQWGPVTPFAMRSTSGPHSWSDLDPGPPPQLGGVDDAIYRQQAVDLIRMSNALDPTQAPGASMINISPSVAGNRPLGTHLNQGYAVNPVTGLPYADNLVKLADHARVLAEYWADGPHSETPPGHWNVIANDVSDNPLTQNRIGGAGPIVDDLQWDVKMYLALNGAVHDAAIAAWGIKRQYDSARPITMVRYMGGKGQSSDLNLSSYNIDGLPLEQDFIELVTTGSIAHGGRHRNAYLLANQDHNGDFFPFFSEQDLVNKVVVHAWNHAPANPDLEVSGADWVLAEHWLPYQMETFITPAFPGYVSGHSTFSRSAAEVMANFTGSPYFPGGLEEALFTPDYLKFEHGPTQAITLQWVSYFDAADDAGMSRRWSGIHPEIDDLPARVLGHSIGLGAYRRASNLFTGVPEPSSLVLMLLAAITLRSRKDWTHEVSQCPCKSSPSFLRSVS
ncbi:MAG: vanadium-dependent haloperoxidase [Pirellulales bacterium]|nr:vanadium-dependent haloperoxidase [Pirellulales bacterium]